MTKYTVTSWGSPLVMHPFPPRSVKKLTSISTLKHVSVLWTGCVYLCMLPRNNKPHIEIARANCCKMCWQLVTLTSGLSMCSLDGKGVPQTAVSSSMQRQRTSSFLRDNITWVMLGNPTWHHSLFLIRILVTTLRNGEMVNISTHTFPFTCSQAFSQPPCCP